jgi:hypothetical protein
MAAAWIRNRWVEPIDGVVFWSKSIIARKSLHRVDREGQSGEECF